MYVQLVVLQNILRITQFLVTDAGSSQCVGTMISHVRLLTWYVCLCVHALSRKWLEPSTTN